MSKRSLFSVLIRSPWWLSILVAAALFMAVRQFLPDYAALASTVPLLVIAAYAGWRQLRAPGENDGAAALSVLRALSRQDFAARVEAAFRREGHAVVALAGGVADYELRRNGRVALVGCRRWKVARTGVEPLRELLQAKQAAGAQDCVYLTAGDVSPNARRFAAQNGIRLLCEEEFVQFLAQAKGGRHEKPAEPEVGGQAP